MRISKLDNRFKLKKNGLATYMIQTPMNDSFPIQKKLEEAYGPGRYVRYGDKNQHIYKYADWYYTHKLENIGDLHLGHYTTCIYLRREDQVSFLTLAMS